MTDVVIPQDLWSDDSEGAISAWFYADGDSVEAGTVIGEVMNEKAASELLAPAAGVLRILVAAEEAVRKGQVVARIG
jgi:pyruvate/2-oxoglutarate dehydrogenase complex dihydrolipoamide acyltransferase (E2) component